MSTMLAFLLCQSETLIAMATYINKDTTSRLGGAVTLSSRMALCTIIQICPTPLHWAWLSCLTIQFKWETKVERSFASVLFLLSHHQELTSSLLKVKWIEQGESIRLGFQ